MFSLFFLIDFVEYPDIVLSEIKDISETACSAPFSLMLKETTLSEQGFSLKMNFKDFKKEVKFEI